MLLLVLLRAALAFGEETITVPFEHAEAGAKASAWRVQCEAKNDGVACGNLGALHAMGLGVARDEALVFHYFEKACRTGQPLRCLRAGTYAANGRGIEKASAAKAAELFALACRLGDADNCIAYYALTHGLKPGFDGAMKPLPDPPKADPVVLDAAVRALRLACESGRANACGNAGGIYEEGDAVAHDSTQALHFYEKACELGEGERCARAARYYANGEGAPPDRAKAETLFRRYCDLGHAIVCPLAEKARHGMPIELKLTSGKSAGGAKAGSPSAAPAPVFLEVISAEGLPEDSAALVAECNRGSARACGNAAARFVDSSGKPQAERAELAFKLYGKACELGRAIRCADLARFYAHGWGTEKSADREAAASRKACGLGHKPSCR